MPFLLIFTFACQTNHQTEKLEDPLVTEEQGSLELPKPIPLPPADALLHCQSSSSGFDVRVFEGQILWNDRQLDIGAHIQAAICADLDQDGVEEAYLGFGMGRTNPKADKQVWKVTETEATEVWRSSSARNQITNLQAHKNQLYITAFTEGKTVAGGPIIDGKWSPIYSVPLALKQVPFEDGMLIGRVYGDEPRADGDLKKYASNTITEYPIQGGVRAISSADFNQDGNNDILVSDGWNYQYGKHAKARVRLYLGPDYTDIRTLVNLDDDYTVNEIIPFEYKQHVHLIAQASHHVYWLEPTAFGIKVHEIGPISESGITNLSVSDENIVLSISGNPSLRLELSL